jgi:hypothetical protein
VKGGLVHAQGGAFRQRIRRNRQRKRIDPFGQLKLAVAAYLSATGRDPATPVQLGIVFPHMSVTAFPWTPSSHIIVADDLAPERLRARLSMQACANPDN